MYNITIQNMVGDEVAPLVPLLNTWAENALQPFTDHADITIRIVDENEMADLNQTYRNKSGPTNILSFPFTLPSSVEEELNLPLRGDIVLCSSLINEQAKEQAVTMEEHWAHLIVHGVLHLLGFDHHTEEEAHEMETNEIELLNQLGFNNPYHLSEINHG